MWGCTFRYEGRGPQKMHSFIKWDMGLPEGREGCQIDCQVGGQVGSRAYLLTNLFSPIWTESCPSAILTQRKQHGRGWGRRGEGTNAGWRSKTKAGSESGDMLHLQQKGVSWCLMTPGIDKPSRTNTHWSTQSHTYTRTHTEQMAHMTIVMGQGTAPAQIACL